MIILDTNVLSELMRPTPAERVLAWVSKQSAVELYTTSITEAEILFGIALLPKGKRRESLLAAAEGIFTQDFGGRIFAFDSDAARTFARIVARRRAIGKPMLHGDGQIAAIAQVSGAKLATRNIDDFRDCNIDLIDPWK